MATKSQETKDAVEIIIKDEPTKKKNGFICKKCGKVKPLKDIRYIPVTQRNRPMEANHITFSSKAEIPICKECHIHIRSV